jgi:Integrase core domain
LTAPRSPTTTGKIERFHRTLRTEFLTGRMFVSLEAAQHELDVWVGSYNTDRPHQSLKTATSAKRFYDRHDSTPPHRVDIGDVGLGRDGPTTRPLDLVDHGRQRISVAAAEHDRVALSCERLGGVGTDAAAGAGNQRNPLLFLS